MKRTLSATEARKLIRNAKTGKRGISSQRISQLLKAGRVVGAYRSGATWMIPQPVRVSEAK